MKVQFMAVLTPHHKRKLRKFFGLVKNKEERNKILLDTKVQSGKSYKNVT